MRSYKDEVDALLDAFGQSQDLEALRTGLHAIQEPRLPPLPRFSGEEIAERLDVEEIDPLLVAVVEFAYAASVVEAHEAGGVPETPASRACRAATYSLLHYMCGIVGPHLVVDFKTIAVPQLLGRVCAACGCSDHDACVPPCSWVTADLCSSCQTRGD